jgi:hemerythrin-like domain-containing protein
MTHPSNPPYEGATLAQLKNENVQHFLYIHNFLRNEMAMLLQLIEELTEGGEGVTAEANQATIRALIRSGSQYGQHLHNHHHGETSLLFPLLKPEGLSTEIINRLNQEHDEIGRLINKVTGALFRLNSAEPDKIQADLLKLAETLRAHLDYEERHVCPLLASWKTSTDFYTSILRGARI